MACGFPRPGRRQESPILLGQKMTGCIVKTQTCAQIPWLLGQPCQGAPQRGDIQRLSGTDLGGQIHAQKQQCFASLHPLRTFRVIREGLTIPLSRTPHIKKLQPRKISPRHRLIQHHFPIHRQPSAHHPGRIAHRIV